MNVTTTTAGSVFQECDFCKVKGVQERSIFNKDGWYFCKPCLLEIEHEIRKRAQEGKNFN